MDNKLFHKFNNKSVKTEVVIVGTLTDNSRKDWWKKTYNKLPDFFIYLTGTSAVPQSYSELQSAAEDFPDGNQPLMNVNAT